MALPWTHARFRAMIQGRDEPEFTFALPVAQWPPLRVLEYTGAEAHTFTRDECALVFAKLEDFAEELASMEEADPVVCLDDHDFQTLTQNIEELSIIFVHGADPSSPNWYVDLKMVTDSF